MQKKVYGNFALFRKLGGAGNFWNFNRAFFVEKLKKAH